VPLEDNLGSLLYCKLRAFDEIGEIGFEERQRGAVGGAPEARHGRGASEFGVKTLQQVEPLGIVG
jgi:hypothetical protein